MDLTKTHYGSVSKNIPEVKLHNLYLAKNPTNPAELSYITRPVISEFCDFGRDMIRGVYFQQGFANDEYIVVAGSGLYGVSDLGVSTLLANIGGGGLCRFASTIYGIAIVTDGLLYIYDGAVLTIVETPDNLFVQDVSSLNNYFVLNFVGSNRFYWILPGEVIIDPLSFASAEANPDHIVSIQTASDELWILGTTTTEVWASTTDADAPFQRISGRIFSSGCMSALTSATSTKNGVPCVLWVSDTREVLLAQGAPSRISNDYIEETLKNSSYVYGGAFRRNRNDFYILTTDLVTLVYDLTYDVWYKWSSFSRDNWGISAFAQKGFTLIGCDLALSSKLYRLIDGSVDDNDEWLVCELTGFVDNLSTKPIRCDAVEVVVNSGFSRAYGNEPIIELRWSDDGGANWGTYMQNTLGDRGETSKRVLFRSLGLIKIPGRRFEFRFTGVDNFRLDFVTINNKG